MTQAEQVSRLPRHFQFLFSSIRGLKKDALLENLIKASDHLNNVGHCLRPFTFVSVRSSCTAAFLSKTSSKTVLADTKGGMFNLKKDQPKQVKQAPLFSKSAPFSPNRNLTGKTQFSDNCSWRPTFEIKDHVIADPRST